MNAENHSKSVWALFADESAARVVLDRVPASQALELSPMGQENPQNALFAETAIIAAFKALRGRKFTLESPLGFRFGFFENVPNEDEGVGLAFVAGFVERTAGLACGVAATGAVTAPEAKAGVSRADKATINEKIVAAMGVLSPGDIILIPSESIHDVLPETKAMAAGKRLFLKGVSCVEEAVSVLLGKPLTKTVRRAETEKQPRMLSKIMVAVVIVLLAMAVFLGWRLYTKHPLPKLVPSTAKTSLTHPPSQGQNAKGPEHGPQRPPNGG